MSHKPRVLIDRHPWTRDEDWARLTQTAELVEPGGEAPVTEEQLIAALQGCQGLMRLGQRLPELSRRALSAEGYSRKPTASSASCGWLNQRKRTALPSRTVHT